MSLVQLEPLLRSKYGTLHPERYIHAFTHTWGGATDSYQSYSTNNQLDQITGSRAKDFTYGALGNLVAKTGYGGNSTYTYNVFNQRVRKTGPGGNFNYLYSPDGALLAETAAGSATLSTQYVWLEGEPIAMIRNNTLYYITSDHLGRPETVMTPGFSVVWKATNTAYDRTVVTDTIGGLNLGFPGQYLDAESGLWYNWNRYPGRMPANGPLGASPSAPRISVGRGPGNPHIDLRVRGLD